MRVVLRCGSTYGSKLIRLALFEILSAFTKNVVIVSKNTRKVDSMAWKISGTRERSMIMASPNPRTLNIFIKIFINFGD